MNKVNTIGYNLVKNNTQTAEKAPYTALPVPVGSLAFDNILTTMLDSGTFMTNATAQYLLKALYEYAAEEIGGKVVRISTGTVSLYPAISGSFPSEDAEFDETKNTLYVGASLSQALRDRVAGVTPTYLGDPTGKSTVKLASVMDLASKTMGVIDGTKAFRLAGVNLTVPDGADESLALYSKDLLTKVCDITVTENDGGLYLKCALPNATAVAKGAYKIRLASHGIDPTDPLAVVTLPVTLVSAITPTPTVTTITGMTQAGQPANTAVLAEDSPVTIAGTLLKLNLEGSDTIGIKLVDAAGEVLDRGILNDKLTENTETQLMLSGFTTLGAATREEWLAGTGRTYLFLYKNGTQHDFPITLVGE